MEILPQILVNGLIAGTLKFMNFAHGEMAMLGAYFYYLFYIGMEWPLFASVAGTLALCEKNPPGHSSSPRSGWAS